MSHMKTALLPSRHSMILTLLSKLQNVIQPRTYPLPVGHAWAHSILPGPVHEGNCMTDPLMRIIDHSTEACQQSHTLYHQNAIVLYFQLQSPHEAAWTTVWNCAAWATTTHTLPMVVNPWGLRPCDLWQMDITHVPSFGKLATFCSCVCGYIFSCYLCFWPL